VDPASGRKVPISGNSRSVPAVWNLASAAGRKVGVVGWWASHPAEEVNGFFVSDHASPILYDKPTLSGSAYPSSLEAGVAQIVEREGHPTPADLARFVDLPPAGIGRILGSDQGMDNAVVALARIVAATRVYHRAARDLYDKNLPDLMTVYIEGTDEIGHFFSPFTPPRLACVSEEDFGRYHRAVEVYYGMVDQMLGQWMRRAEEDHATLLVNSDHGSKVWAKTAPASALLWLVDGRLLASARRSLRGVGRARRRKGREEPLDVRNRAHGAGASRSPPGHQDVRSSITAASEISARGHGRALSPA
jgi:predicted AlkP superfamily phosphohydrolase/phosphomutase